MEEPKKLSPTVEIHYEKNQLYRTIFADGAIGGLTPSGSVNLTFYATRLPIPKSVVHGLNDEGFLGELQGIGKDSKSGIIREIEFGVYMNKQTVKDLYDFFKKIVENDGK